MKISQVTLLVTRGSRPLDPLASHVPVSVHHFSVLFEGVGRAQGPLNMPLAKTVQCLPLTIPAGAVQEQAVDVGTVLCIFLETVFRHYLCTIIHRHHV